MTRFWEFSSKSFGVRGRPFGVIDIGSNSVRLVVYERESGSVTPVFNEKVLCALGRSVATGGRLSDDAMDRALAALARFRAMADRLGVSDLQAVATAAVRDAANGSQFVAQAQKTCGVEIDVIAGEREALLAAKGIMMGFVAPNGIAGDLGGGSLELIDIQNHDVAAPVTLPLGGLRLAEASGGDLVKARSMIEEHLDSVAWLSEGKGRTLYAVGGTWRAIAKLHMSAINYPLHVTQGYAISASEAKAFARTIFKSKRLSDFSGIDEISRARREVVPFGALVMERLLARMKPEQVVFSVFGVREGLLYEALSEEERSVDPLLVFCENFASVHARSIDYARELCTWTDPLFVPPGREETDEQRRLRYAACLLCDVGWRRHPDYRDDQVPGMVAYSGLSGIDHPGRVFLALTIFHRYAGVGAPGRFEMWAGSRDVIGPVAENRARLIAAAARVAHVLAAGMPGLIGDTPVALEGGKVVLSIPSKHAVLDGERLRRRFSQLGSLIGLEPEVRVG